MAIKEVLMQKNSKGVFTFKYLRHLSYVLKAEKIINYMTQQR